MYKILLGVFVGILRGVDAVQRGRGVLRFVDVKTRGSRKCESFMGE